MWRCAVLVALVSLTATAADDEKDKAVKQEQEKLQGKWKVVSHEFSGAASKSSYDEPDELARAWWLTPSARSIGSFLPQILHEHCELTNSTFFGNTGFDGGAIGNFESGGLTMTNSTLNGNTATGGDGRTRIGKNSKARG